MKKEQKWCFEVCFSDGVAEFEIFENREDAEKYAKDYYNHVINKKKEKAASGNVCWAVKYNMVYDEGDGKWYFDESDPDPVEYGKDYFSDELPQISDFCEQGYISNQEEAEAFVLGSLSQTAEQQYSQYPTPQYGVKPCTKESDYLRYQLANKNGIMFVAEIDNTFDFDEIDIDPSEYYEVKNDNKTYYVGYDIRFYVVFADPKQAEALNREPNGGDALTYDQAQNLFEKLTA
jgi:hypothetical protein